MAKRVKGEIPEPPPLRAPTTRDATLDQITGLLEEKRDEFEPRAGKAGNGLEFRAPEYIHVWLANSITATVRPSRGNGSALDAFSKRLGNVTPGGALAGHLQHDVF